MKKALLMILLIFVVFTSYGQETIQWRVTNWPPMYILEGPYKGQGVVDKMLDVFEEELSEYKHNRIKMNTTRAWNQIKAGEKVCHPSTFPRPYGVLSNVSFLIPPHRIVMRTDKVGGLNGQTEISLDQLIADKRFKLGVSYGRYGSTLNPIVDKHKGEKMIYKTAKYQSIWKMLFLGRIDYTIEYPFIINYLKKDGQESAEITYIKIQEAPTPFKVYIGCPENEWGRKVIDKINSILFKRRDRFREFMESWLDPQSVGLLREAYQKEFGASK